MKTGIYLDGGKMTPLRREALRALARALDAAIAAGRETAACAIAEKIGQFNNTVISGCSIGDK